MAESKKEIHDNLHYLIRLLHETLGISFFFFDAEYNVVNALSEWEIYMKNFFLLNCDIDLKTIIYTDDPTPRFLCDAFSLNWIIHPLPGKKLFLLMGPTFESDFTNNIFQKKMEFQQMSVSSKIKFLKMVQSIPVISFLQLDTYSNMIYYTLYGKKCKSMRQNTLRSKSLNKKKQSKHIPDSHGSRYDEFERLRAIKEGVFLSDTNIQNKETVVGMLAPDDPLRQMKDLIIIQVTLSARAAIEGGMEYEAAFSLSDSFIQQIEFARTEPEVHAISDDITYIYTSEVQKVKQQGYSPMTKYACTYIDKHLLNNFKLEDLSKELGYDMYYISRVFHKDTGHTINEYITKKKIDRAKDLLLSTRMDITEISDLLQFSSASYFSRIFKKETGKTPTSFQKTP